MSSIVDGALRAVEMFHPELTPFLEQIIKYEPQLQKLAPVVEAGIKEGPGALAAAEKEAPEFVASIRNFVRSIPGTAATHEDAAAIQDQHAENVLRKMFSPMTPDEEQAWMNRTSPVGDSQTGSG